MFLKSSTWRRISRHFVSKNSTFNSTVKEKSQDLAKHGKDAAREGIKQAKSVTEDIKNMTKEAADRTKETLKDAMQAAKELFTGHTETISKSELEKSSHNTTISEHAAGLGKRAQQATQSVVEGMTREVSSPKEDLAKKGEQLRKEEEEKNQM